LARERQGEHGANSSRLHHRTKGLIKVHTRPLGKTAENPARLVPPKEAIRLKLVLEDPLTSDDIGLRGAEAQDPMCDFSAEHCVRPPWLLTNWGRLERYGRSSASETKGQRGTLQGPKTHSSHASPWSVESSLEGPGQHPWAVEEQVEWLVEVQPRQRLVEEPEELLVGAQPEPEVDEAGACSSV
jgi:hypothetical protein